MKKSKKLLFLIISLAIFGLAVLTFTTALAATKKLPAVKSVNNNKFGKILTDSKGLTLYTFDNDKNGKSSCYGQCAIVWPPLIVSASPAGSADVQKSLGMTVRTDGKKQATYNKMPLYRYYLDTKPGYVNGDGINKVWHVAKTPAAKIKVKPAAQAPSAPSIIPAQTAPQTAADSPQANLPVSSPVQGNSGQGASGRPFTRAIKDKSSDSIMVDIDGVNYNVLVKDSTVILNSAGKNITFQDLKVGDQIRLIVNPAEVFTSPHPSATWIQDYSL